MAESMTIDRVRDYLDDLVPPRPAEMEVMEAYPDSLPVVADKLRPGGVLIVDNMFWGGRIFDDSDTSPSTQGVRDLTRLIMGDPAWIASIVPIRDGLLVACKK